MPLAAQLIGGGCAPEDRAGLPACGTGVTECRIVPALDAHDLVFRSDDRWGLRPRRSDRDLS